MSEWKAKRFWKDAQVVEADGGFAVELDGRACADAAEIGDAPALAPHGRGGRGREWDAQEGEIRPLTMPVTRAANAAIDKVEVQHAEVADMLAAYGDSDLLCYRADSPQELIARQAEAWDPLLDWADETFGARLIPVEGVMHAPQDHRALERLARPVHEMDAFRLTAFHDLVGISGSLIVGFAAIHEARDIGELWRLSRIDETWQEEQWGIDEEARAQAEMKESDFYAAKRFHDLARDA